MDPGPPAPPTCTPSKNFEKSLDDANWESFAAFQSTRPATEVLIDCRRISSDDNIIGLRLGKILKIFVIKKTVFRTK